MTVERAAAEAPAPALQPPLVPQRTRAGSAAAANAAAVAAAAVDEYVAWKGAMEPALPEPQLWERVLNRMRLSNEQLEPYAEVRRPMCSRYRTTAVLFIVSSTVSFFRCRRGSPTSS